MKLNQVIAVEKSVKSRTYGEITEMHHESEKPVLFNGFNKTYRKKNEDGDDLPPEQQKVQREVSAMLGRVQRVLTEAFDITAMKDWANCNARADVVVDGKTIVKDAPATYLLFLEKQLIDIHTFVSKLPELDEAEDWHIDPNTSLYKTLPFSTHRTKKNQKAIVLYPATPEHPAQTQLITEDEVVGYWDTIKQSGAIPKPRKREILERVEKLNKAVKSAREQANSVEAENVSVGESFFSYLFA